MNLFITRALENQSFSPSCATSLEEDIAQRLLTAVVRKEHGLIKEK